MIQQEEVNDENDEEDEREESYNIPSCGDVKDMLTNAYCGMGGKTKAHQLHCCC